MQDALEMGKKSAAGSFHLFMGVASSTVIMAVAAIILARLMTPEEYGLYSVAFIPSYIAVLFRDWGVNSAIIKYVSRYRVENRRENVYEIIVSGLIFEAAAGLVLSAILFLLSNFVASTMLCRPQASPLIMTASVTVFAGALLTASQSSFIGFERMELNSLTSICQALVKTVASPVLVFIGFSAFGATLGYTLSYLVAAIVGLAALYLIVFRELKAENTGKISVLQTLKRMLRYGVPLSLASIISGFAAQFYAFLMAIHCADAMIGNYQIATQFATLLTFFTIPISTVMFPVFSKINPEKDHELLNTVFVSSVKYTAALLVPATMAIMVLSKPMISTLYGEKWTYAPLFLTLYVINNFFVLFGGLILGSLLTGLGETETQLKLSVITLALGIPLAFTLIPSMGIFGLILTGIVTGISSTSIGLYWVWKHYKTKADIKSSAKILLASLTATATAFLITNIIVFAEWIELAVGGLAFLIAYLAVAPTIGAINQTDINNLKTMFSGLGAVSKLLNIPLATMEKLANKL